MLLINLLKGGDMRKLIVFAILLSLPCLYGFATIVSGTKQDVTINSSPSGAEVTINGFVRGVTPLTLNLKRKQNQSITLKKEGYQAQVVPLSHEFNATFWGNALIGGLIGSSIDSSTGATIEYKPSNFHITLTPDAMSKVEREEFNRVTEARSFILSNYYSLTSDIAEGEGEYLSNLYAAFEKGYQDSKDTLDKLKVMVTKYDSIPAFADAVVKSFISS